MPVFLLAFGFLMGQRGLPINTPALLLLARTSISVCHVVRSFLLQLLSWSLATSRRQLTKGLQSEG